MIKKLTGTLVFGLLYATNANAATVSLTGPVEVPQNLSFHVQIWGDFGFDGLLRGGVQVFFDPALVQIDDITRHLGEPSFSCPGPEPGCPVDPPGTASIVWGAFLNPLIPAGAPLTLMATLSFTAIGPGTTSFPIADFSFFTGGWDGANEGSIDIPNFHSTAVDVNVNQCTGGDGDNATLLIAVVDSVTCVARVSVNVLAGTQVFGPDGHLHLTAPSTGVQSGFEVFEGGRVTVTSADPCSGCSP